MHTSGIGYPRWPGIAVLFEGGPKSLPFGSLGVVGNSGAARNFRSNLMHELW